MRFESQAPTADAVRAPIRHAGTGPAAARLERLGVEFAGPLAAGRIYVRLQGAEHFITADPDDTLLFPLRRPPFGASALPMGGPR